MDGIPTIETPVAKTGWKGLEFVASFTLWDPKNSAMEEILKSHWIGWREQKTTGNYMVFHMNYMGVSGVNFSGIWL
jgi:hypothetical protein